MTESLKNDTGFSAIDQITKDATLAGAGDDAAFGEITARARRNAEQITNILSSLPNGHVGY